jgi:hypothetical protein
MDFLAAQEVAGLDAERRSSEGDIADTQREEGVRTVMAGLTGWHLLILLAVESTGTGIGRFGSVCGLR